VVQRNTVRIELAAIIGKHAQQITKQASVALETRAQDHVQCQHVYEIADQSFREFTNATDSPVRWDFFRLMKKWQIDLIATNSPYIRHCHSGTG